MNQKYAFCFGESDKKRLEILNDICNIESQQFLMPYLQKGMNVLEAGCGHGHMLPWLLEKVGEAGSVTALDADKEQLNVIKNNISSRKNLYLKTGSVYDLEKLNMFDCIYCRFLLMHLEDADRAVKSMYSKLCKNGVLLIEEPNLSANFCFPESQEYKTIINLLIQLGKFFNHDYDIGLKLIDKIKKLGASITAIKFSQPVLYREHKSLLRESFMAAADKLIDADLITKCGLKTLIGKLTELENDDNYIFVLSRQTQIAAVKN